MSYKVLPRDGYFELYINGLFYCFGNTWNEVSKKLDRARITSKERM